MQRQRKGLLKIFEAVVLYKNLPKEKLISSVKRSTDYVFSKDGFFRNILFLGSRETPFRITKGKVPFYEANYMFYEFSMPPDRTVLLSEELKKDRDVIKHCFFNVQYPQPTYNFEKCTFADEMKPVPERPEVMEYVKLAQNLDRKKNRKKFKFNMNCDFYPFQR